MTTTKVGSTITEPANKKARGPHSGPRILLGVTGSVAAVKAPEVVVQLVTQCKNAEVKVVLSRGGQTFWDKAADYDPESCKRLRELLKQVNENGNPSVEIHDADEEWKDWNRLGDPVLHIDLRDWADLLVLMPLSAHSLAKVAHGLADDTLSCVARAWDFGHGDRPGKPVLLAPAMNTAMWQHVLTAQQLATIQGFWNSKRAPYNRIKICPPQVKALACGEVGDGALASVDVIVETIQEIIEEIYLEWRVIENIRATSH